MADSQWIENMKKIVLQAVEAGGPCDFIAGEVVSVNPLAVKIDQKITLGSSQIYLPQSLTDHKRVMVLPELGEVEVIVKNALKAGEKILLLQKRGGQSYLALDRWKT